MASSSPQQQHQQQQEEQFYDRQEEYLSAQRAAVEAVHVGRQTLQQSVQQGEQLSRAEQMAEETEYKLDKAGRILRGMTWSGWVANVFSSSVGPPPDVTTTTTRQTAAAAHPDAAAADSVPWVYDAVTPECRDTAQAIQNYHANVKVLEACETEEQKQTLKMICDTMYDTANKSLIALKQNHPAVEAYAHQFEQDLAILRNRQKQSQEITRQLGVVSPIQAGSPSGFQGDKNRAELFGSVASEEHNSPPKAEKFIHPQQREQDEHLSILSQSLGELGTIAKNLNQSMEHQNSTIDSLDGRTDNVTEKSKMLTRRADRMVQKRSWQPVKPKFHSHVAIRHVATGKYLAALDPTDLYLVPRFHPETCVFGLWKRQGLIFGLQNKYSRKWAGQSLFGGLACSASQFGHREEWEADGDVDEQKDWSTTGTRLLCASAGWGAGGYLSIDPQRRSFALKIGGCTVEERNNADLWAIIVQTNVRKG